MKNIFISTYFGSIFFISFVGIGAQNVFLEAIQEVQQQVEQLIDPSDRYEFSQEYNAFVEYFQEFNIEEVFITIGSQNIISIENNCYLCPNSYIETYRRERTITGPVIYVITPLF